MPTLSVKFQTLLKLHEKPQYRIAQEAGIHPVTLSKLVCGISPVYKDDPRIISVGRALGLAPEECFESGDK